MIRFPHKRVFSLIGPPRVGKDEVANFLKETRGFTIMAFADQIKQEFGISKEDFEAAKISGNIDKVRQELWDFTEEIKKSDPHHFIRGVIDRVEASENSVVITDIRTEDELNAFYGCKASTLRVYRIYGRVPDAENGYIIGSKLSDDISKYTDYIKSGKMKFIVNNKDGVFYFHQDLEKFFFHEDLDDIHSNDTEKKVARKYLFQFDIRQKGSIYEK